jgi:folate-dependent phosphoribosylglycinamide formyltransferase PurN
MSGNWYWGEKEGGANFNGPHETREDAIAEAQSELERPDGFWIGQSHTVEAAIDADCVIDQWANADGVDLLYEDALDHWCSRIQQHLRDALSEELSSVFRKHLESWEEETSWEVISSPLKFLIGDHVAEGPTKKGEK